MTFDLNTFNNLEVELGVGKIFVLNLSNNNIAYDYIDGKFKL